MKVIKSATRAKATRERVLRGAIAEIVGPGGVDVVVDNTGLPEMIQFAYELVNPKGRVILVGVPKAGNKIAIYSLPLHFGKVLTGSHGGETQPQSDIPRYLRLLEAGKLSLTPLLTDDFPLEQINEALDGMHR